MIVPVYNAEGYLARCVDSILGQSYPDIEVILIDDGSKDQSGELCDAYAANDARVRAYHKENGGVSSARNMGIDYAHGDYLVFVDSDDSIHRDLVAVYMEALEDGMIPICSFSCGGVPIKDTYLDCWKEQVEIFRMQHFMRFYKTDLVNMPWNKLYDAEVIHSYGMRFDESKSLGEDLLFNLEYFRRKKSDYKVIHCPLYYYQEGREGSLENSYYPHLFELQLELFQSLQDFLVESGSWEEEEQKLFYALFWDRLYLTLRIYHSYIERRKEESIWEMIEDALNNDIWKRLGKKCSDLGQMNWKRRLKKMHLKIWKKRAGRNVCTWRQRSH